MRLMSKKLNPPSVPPVIAGIFLLSLLYWLYLALTTRMEIVWDSIEYRSLGRMLESQGWIPYFTTGPHREPLYPLLIAASMRLEQITGFAYDKIMAFLGVIIMFLTQIMTYKILRLLNVRTAVCAMVLAYLAVSPALNNAAFSLYSEIAAFPVILGMVLAGTHAWNAVEQKDTQKAWGYGALLGLLLAAATFIKAVFECVAPVFLIMLFLAILREKKIASSGTALPAMTQTLRQAKQLGLLTQRLSVLLLCMAAALSFYYVPVTGYKWLNMHYNGSFAVTNRGSWALYGSTARRMQPLTFKRLAEAAAYAPGEGVCNALFGPQECDFWSYRKSDQLGFSRQNALNDRHLPIDQANALLLKESKQMALHNPFQYVLLTVIEGLKMFFWESTRVGFVRYPPWLQRIYDMKMLDNLLRLLTAAASLMAVMSLWFGRLKTSDSPAGFLMGALIFLYILFFSLFFILTRYALPVAPLFLMAIGVWINQNLAPKKAN
jgi:hypothetical protein